MDNIPLVERTNLFFPLDDASPQKMQTDLEWLHTHFGSNLIGNNVSSVRWIT